MTLLPIIKKCLSTKSAVESKKKLRNCENHIFVEKVENHL